MVPFECKNLEPKFANSYTGRGEAAYRRSSHKMIKVSENPTFVLADYEELWGIFWGYSLDSAPGDIYHGGMHVQCCQILQISKKI